MNVIYRGFLRKMIWKSHSLLETRLRTGACWDGKRSIQYTDGAKFYKYFFQQTTGSLERGGISQDPGTL